MRRRVPTVAAALLLAALATTGPAHAADPTPEPFLTGLSFPTNMAFAPDGRIFFGEKQTGRIRIVKDGALLARPFATLDVEGDAERGLLGLALDPDFPRLPWVYVYFSDAADGRNRLIRIRARGDQGGLRETLLDGLDASPGYHNGGDIAFGTDGRLYLTIGEGHDGQLAQDPASLGGKVIRLNPDGSIPDDNPFAPDGDPNPVYSKGHRNSFGLCVDPANGDLWETENGPDINDEVNLIQVGGNYGWPYITGRVNQPELVDPVVVFHDTVALTGCAVVEGDIYFGAFKDGVLRVLRADARDNGDVQDVATFSMGITDVQLGPDGMLYVATADSIYRIMPATASTPSPSVVASPTATGAAVDTPPTEGGSGIDARGWIAIAAVLAIVLGLTLRLAAGRRLRDGRHADRQS